VSDELLDSENSSRDVWADSAYLSQETIERLKEDRYREHFQRKGTRRRKLSKCEQQGNRTRSGIRSRIEHVFGILAQWAGNLILRGIGIAGATSKTGLRNLAFNLDQFGTLCVRHS
jgi:hypothetical protein